MYVVTLNDGTATAVVSNFTVTATTPFALDAVPNQVSFWPGCADGTSLEISRQTGTALQIQMLTWNGNPATNCSWTESSPTSQTLAHSLFGLKPGDSYSLNVNSNFVQAITVDVTGKLTFQQVAAAGEPATLSLTLAP